MAKHEIWELRQKQSLPLNLKISLTKARIRQWINEYGEDGVYVSFSGGKDSTVLLDLVRQDYPKVKAVFFDTGLEYPEIREFVKGYENVDWIKPKMNFRDVVTKYGYPMISKEVSECVQGARKYLTSLIERGIVLTERNGTATIPLLVRQGNRAREIQEKGKYPLIY
jgi:PP-loop superfamily ATP-utilizing enzyme